MLQDERPVVLHLGVYKPTATTFEGVFMITGMMIGAGILALPSAVAGLGVLVGAGLMLFVGLVTLILHLALGEVAVRTAGPMQLPGFAGKYLGRWAEGLVSVTIILRSFGALLAYLIGSGAVLSALFGGRESSWTAIFWSLGSLLVWAGLARVKLAEKIIGSVVILVVIGISFYLFPSITLTNLDLFNFTNWLAPLGVILFAFSATPAIAEAHAVLPGSERRFRRALIIGTLLSTLVYILFAVAVVGVLGDTVTEVATVALGNKFGAGMLLFANIFAILAMSTAYMGVGTALKETFIWDYKIKKLTAAFLVAVVPIGLFVLGLRSFILILEVVGGIFIATENIIMALVFYKARLQGDIKPKYFRLPHAIFFTGVVLITYLAVLGVSLYDIGVKLFY
ncbi:MAG: aromatic amino acid transport family protein [Candidatus Magasanikbacteria bacterium]|nr:aromatic amino acid transport family protein [Candidatus Magasanikbacteria bacterium]